MSFLFNLTITVAVLAITALTAFMVLTIGAAIVFVGFIFFYPEHIEEMDHDNIEQQAAYLAKRISRAWGESEFKYWNARITEFENTYVDHPDVYTEAADLRKALCTRIADVTITKTLQKVG